MPVEFNIHRARVGLHHFRHFKVKGLENLIILNLLHALHFYSIRLVMSRKNPGPVSVSASDSSQSFHFPPLQGNLSMVHYNVQSSFNKLDLIEAEFSDYSIISLIETWLNETKPTEDLVFNGF